MKISYLSGPADVPRFLREMDGAGVTDFFGTNYMKLFLEFARQIVATSQIFTWHDGKRYEADFEQVHVLNWPMKRASGARYHLALFIWNLRAMFRMVGFRPDVLLLTGHQQYWWVYAPLRLLGTKFIASYHSAQWAGPAPQGLVTRTLTILNSLLAVQRMSAILSTSRIIREQVQIMLGGKPVPIFDHLPSYSAGQFAGVEPPRRDVREPFEIMFTGRIEADKGVFDLLEIARSLDAERPSAFLFHVCGDGGARETFVREIEAAELQSTVVVYGHCDPARLRSVLSRSHCCIVPTRLECNAGFEMTCAEAILADRPLISSAACPAIYYLKPATIEVPPDDVAAYRRAVVALADDEDLYWEKQQACAPLKPQFLEEEFSWRSAIRKAFRLSVSVPTQTIEDAL